MINHETKYWYLKNHKLFSNLNPQEVKEICLISNFKTAQKGEAIFFNHDDVQRVYTVKRGTIKIIENDADGNEDRKSTRLNSSHLKLSRMPSSA